MIAMTFKLGGIPYTYWIMRVYPVIEKGILLIQLIVSKYVYILLMLRLEEIINPGWEKGMFKNTIMIIGIGGVLYGAYKGVKQKTYKGIIASSSILTLGIILISIRYGYKDQINEGRVGILINKYKELGEMPWEINHAIIIYILNILLLFGIYYGKKKNSLGLGIISLLSLIGVPPLAGFYSKVYLLTPIITKAVNNEGGQKGLVEWILKDFANGVEVWDNEKWGARAGMGIIIITSILSFYYYFKIILKGGVIEINEVEEKKPLSVREGEGMLKGVLTIIIVFYVYFIPFIFPFFG